MNARSFCVLASCIALTAASSPDIQVTENSDDSITVTAGAALIQSTRFRRTLGDGIVEAGLEEKASEAATTAGIDGSHLVCHSTDCNEVKALMAAQTAKQTKVQAALTDCANKRKSLSADLGMAAQKRGEAEVALAKCATERKKLQEDLEKCGKDRAKAEADLAKCASDRAKLEAELKQCAEVDRPNAEKALQQCGKDRAELEKKLTELVKKLSSKSSLTQIAVQESSEHADLLAEESDLRSQLAAQVKLAGDYADAVDAIDKKVEGLLNKASDIETKFEKAAGAAEAADERSRGAIEKLESHQTKLASLATDADKAGEELGKAINKVHEGAKEFAKAQGDLASEIGAQADSTVQLLQLNIAAHEDRRVELARDLEQQMESKEQLKTTLEEQKARGDADADCDKTRGELVTLQGKIDATKAALDDCLSTKKVLQAKIDATTAARLEAESGLAACLATKARLKKALEDCLTRKAATQKKLTECLDRKKVLKTKIDECHKKRDEARKKLTECLARKEELKKKIKAAEAKLDASFLQTEHATEFMQASADLRGALVALRESNRAYEEFEKDSEDSAQALFDASKEMAAHTQDENKILNEMASEDEDTSVSDQLGKLGTELAAVASSVAKQGALEKGAKTAADESVKKIG